MGVITTGKAGLDNAKYMGPTRGEKQTKLSSIPSKPRRKPRRKPSNPL
jgi:hypothetical protein